MKEVNIGKPLYYDSTRISLGQFQTDVDVVLDLAIHDLSIIDFLYPELELDERHILKHNHITTKSNQAIIDFWKSCNGKRKVTELVDLFSQQTGLQRNQVEKEVMQLIKQLHDGGLLVISNQTETPNVEFKKEN